MTKYNHKKLREEGEEYLFGELPQDEIKRLMATSFIDKDYVEAWNMVRELYFDDLEKSINEYERKNKNKKFSLECYDKE